MDAQCFISMCIVVYWQPYSHINIFLIPEGSGSQTLQTHNNGVSNGSYFDHLQPAPRPPAPPGPVPTVLWLATTTVLLWATTKTLGGVSGFEAIGPTKLPTKTLFP